MIMKYDFDLLSCISEKALDLKLNANTTCKTNISASYYK